MIPEREFDEHAARLGVVRRVVEQDYALGWILWAIAREPELSSALAFKGGTALKKVIFGEYRFSEDLDFGVVRQALKPPRLRPAVERMLSPLEPTCGIRVELLSFKRTKDVYGAEVFRVMLGYDWPGVTALEQGHRAKLDLHYRGGVVEPPMPGHVMHPYSDAADFGHVEVATCTLEEVVAEKLLALLLQSRTGAARPRDYYDVDRILCALPDRIDRARLRRVFAKKLRHPSPVPFTGLEELFPGRHLASCRILWDADVRSVALDAEAFDVVIARLRQALPSWVG